MRPAIYLALLIVFAGCAGQTQRASRDSAKLLAARDAADRAALGRFEDVISRNLARIKSDYDDFVAGNAPAPPVVDLLVISGGGDWGAFGAGVLKGWGTVPPGPMARPQFDAVTGVSTGALIAPFAFLGDNASIDKVNRLYRNPQKDWVQRRGWLTLLGGTSSFATIPGLERDLKKALDQEMVRRIARLGASGRILAVNTTNIDTGEMQVWDMVDEAKRTIATSEVDQMEQILLASAAVPGIFPPRQIDGTLYVDGAVTGNILYGGRQLREDNDTFVARWQTAYPNAPIPKIRYWIIFNNQIRPPPEIVQPQILPLVAKSSTAATRAETLNAMRQLFVQARLAKVHYDADVEIRIVAIPDDWVEPKPGVFVKETMNALADLGERIGADSTSWRTQPP